MQQLHAENMLLNPIAQCRIMFLQTAAVDEIETELSAGGRPKKCGIIMNLVAVSNIRVETVTKL